MSDVEENLVTPKRKNGIRHSEMYGNEPRKLARIKGDEFTNKKGRTMAKRCTGANCRLVFDILFKFGSFLKV
jgi:hypothetical protein